jgi:hypothetical protein
MNERILELADKAVEDMPSGPWNIPDEFCKKFAELIIKECARSVDKVYEDAEPDHGCYDWATFAQGSDVLKHFGVK